LYDTANSVFPLLITSSFFPVFYYSQLAKYGKDGVLFFGQKVSPVVVYSSTIAFSYFLATILAAILSPIADKKGIRKHVLLFFAITGSIGTSLLFFFNSEHLELSMIPFAMGLIGYSASIVFYNSFLALLFKKEEQDIVSAMGFAMGYLGSSLLMIVFMVWIGSTPSQNKELIIRTSFLVSGIWWFALSFIPYFSVREIRSNIENNCSILKETISIIAKSRKILLFLIGFFLYDAGIQTVMLVAALFGKDQINIPDETLLILILVLQFIAIPGSFVVAIISSKIGNIKTLLILSILWCFLMIFAFFMTNTLEFVVAGVIIGFLMGGAQSLSRSTFSSLTYNYTNQSTFFTIYDLVEKIAIFTGNTIVALTTTATGSVRYSSLAIAFLFAISIVPLIACLNINLPGCKTKINDALL